MPHEIRLWRVNQDSGLDEIEQQGLDLESRLEDWLVDDISMLGLDLLVIGRQVETDFGGYIDLLCMDAAGDLVVVELKRDRTPRRIVGQMLDYASWVADLSNPRVTQIADGYLGDEGPLDAAFRRRFGESLPDVLNESHRMLTVAAELDSSSERIIRYLSDEHGVNINAVTFQYFQEEDAGELLGRVFLIDPGEVEDRVRRKGSSKRKPPLTYEQLEQLADERGLGDLYRELVELFSPVFKRDRRTRSSLSFMAEWQGSTRAVLNLYPGGKDGGGEGLPFELYTYRAAETFGCSPEDIVAVLPEGTTDWKYQEAPGRDWEGHAGAFTGVEQGRRLVKALTS